MSRPALVLVACVLFAAGCTRSTMGPCSDDSQCTPGRCCSGKCVDVQTSTAHCGSCSAACGSTNGAAKCTAGVCSISCSSGFGDCNLMSKDGCETALSNTTAHCGKCGNTCTAANANQICERNVCLQSSCKSGFGDCNSSETDGCEVDLKKTVAHCGSCAKKCEIADGVADCFQSACIVASCNPDFGDCDLSPATGCETDLKTTDAHCGGCGMACTAGYHCKLSKCVAPELVFYGGVLGISSSIATNQVSAFNVDTHAWSAVATTGAETPGSRFGHVAVWDAVGNQMVVWGGFMSGNGPTDNNVWSLDYSVDPDGGTTPAWKKLTTTGGGPASSRGLASWAWDKATRTLFIYGGADQAAIYGELWQLDLATLKWTQRGESGGPGARYQTVMVWDTAKQRVLVGQGLDDNFFTFSDFYAFDPAADGGGWSLLAASNPPIERAGSTFLGEAQPLQVWGGQDDFGDLIYDHFQLDDLDAGARWTRLYPDNAPPERGFPTAASILDRRFLFGGYSGFSSAAITEVWELSADAGWSRIADGGINFVHPGAVFPTAVARE